jgi:dTDP-4-amino-4,6-dideoxygalactose transaminase
MKKFTEPIYITRPNLPSLEDLQPYLKKIWENRIVTNNGPFHQEFEKKLAEHLGVGHVNLFTNATLGLIVGLQVLRITGDVITTPFTFVATTHALQWNGINPIFCDIEQETLNIDPQKVEALITPKTTAILAVHVYGHPCDTNRIQNIADKYGLKVLYDAAHAFDVNVDGKTILEAGDLSVLSFHGTKLFTTFEGGAIVSKDESLKKRVDFLKNFGIADEVTVIGPGINAKMNEFQSAMGLLSLGVVKEEIAKRKRVAMHYRNCLGEIKGIKTFGDLKGVEHNYAYFPVLVDENEFGISRDRLYEELKTRNVFARRYFYTLISNLSTYRNLPSASKDNLPVANALSDRILCLPIYGSIPMDVVDAIVEMILDLKR